MFLSMKEKSSGHQMSVLILTFLLLLLMGTILASSLLDIDLGLETLFPSDQNSAFTVSSGRPSYGTLIAFMLIGCIALFEGVTLDKFAKFKTIFSILVLIIAIVALLGYLFNVPVLYYYFESLSTAMAFNTAILFLLLGVGFLEISKRQK